MALLNVAPLHAVPNGARPAWDPVPSALRPRVLLLQTEAVLVQAIQHSLLPVCSTVQIADTLQQAQGLLAQGTWDVLLLELHPKDGLGMEALRFVQGSGLDVGRVVLTGAPETKLLEAIISLQVHALLFPPLSASLLRETVQRCFATVLRQRQQAREAAFMQEQVAVLLRQRTVLQEEMQQLETSVTEALLAALAAREVDCVLHSLRLQAYTRYFARLVAYPEGLRVHLEHAALLHDIGKIGLSDLLLFRPGTLSPAEVERMRPHTILGEQILNCIHFLRPAAMIVRHHHERFDGQGFPDGLHGENIPLGSRIFSIMDTLDAITNDRPYRLAQSYEAARLEVGRCAGTHFDPRLTAAFLQVSPATWADLRHQVEVDHAKRSPLPFFARPLSSDFGKR
jgi:response regulator RpfG family c-di-GMP phosphodiesterase